MNELDELLDETSRRARSLATSVFEEEERRPLHPMIIVMRDGEEIAVIMLANHERDEILAAARMAAGGFAADMIAVVQDTYQAKIEINPRTGQPWAPGEMQEVARYFDGIANGWVEEALVSECVDRHDELRVVIQPYQRGERSVKWGKEMHPDAALGIIPRTLRAIMRESPFDPGGGDEERDMSDAVTVSLIHKMTNGAILLTANPDGRRAKRLGEYLADLPDVEVSIVPPMYGVN